ncbi:hypothetical protein ZIOFF_061117 [Zingiber officinale]|uniref:Deoxyuridine 5'-triphosphate nucleotidohydrolase n=1 Tax=Zingiber officinale TaxID=94328 RepID=A0A8J5FCD1_ZINOF|nr:hypothetical protein ZIOFF_061117 [Zingiber officinale]
MPTPTANVKDGRIATQIALEVARKEKSRRWLLNLGRRRRTSASSGGDVGLLLKRAQATSGFCEQRRAAAWFCEQWRCGRLMRAAADNEDAGEQWRSSVHQKAIMLELCGRLSLEFSEGYYARIAPRSGSAYKLNFIVNAGVIDSDFRGEVCLLIYNFSDLTLSLEHGRSIAQLVFEKIITPPVWEVNDLRQTIRETGSFGSTEIEEPRSSVKSTIDAEIHACMEALTAMKIHYLDRKEITLRTDCVDIKFEHISGTSNELADALSRLVYHITNKASLSDDQRQFLKQVDESMDETQGADDTVKGVLGKTIIALMAKVTFEKS